MRFSAWLTQEHAPGLNGVGLRKLLASSGSPRHDMLYNAGQGSLPPADHCV
ncbi:MAG: hypothetical protein HKP41_12800 [Desulfobacterales bacterium]|nr:hypothetical protein [Desulfobacterales bacterium]